MNCTAQWGYAKIYSLEAITTHSFRAVITLSKKSEHRDGGEAGSRGGRDFLYSQYHYGINVHKVLYAWIDFILRHSLKKYVLYLNLLVLYLKLLVLYKKITEEG